MSSLRCTRGPTHMRTEAEQRAGVAQPLRPADAAAPDADAANASKVAGRPESGQAESTRPVGVAARRPLWLTVLERYGLVLLFAATILCFSFYSGSSKYFLTAANIQNVLGNQCITITLAVASLLPLVCGRFDLSVGANA